MSNQLNETSVPLPYGSAPAIPGNSTITIVAIMSIVMGAIGFLTCGVLSLLGGMGSGDITLPDGTIAHGDPGLATVGIILGSVGIFSSGALLLCGVGALMRRSSARIVAIGVASLVLAVAVARFVVTLAYTGPKVEQLQQQMQEASSKRKTQQGAPPPPNDMVPFHSGGAITTGVVMFVLEALTPTLILSLWTRRRVIDAFDAGVAERSGRNASGVTGPGPGT
jgi:hypothetical protein